VLIGSLLAAAGAFCYGVTIAFSRSLARAQLPPPTALGLRFGIAAVALFALLGPRRWRGAEVRACLALGVVYGVESTFFYMALQRGTAAAVTLLFYSYPAMVTAVEMLAGRERPGARPLAALVLCTGGAAVVAVAGGDVAITTAGIALSFAAAATFSLYLIAGDRVLGDTGPMAKAAWVVAGCAVFHLLRGAVAGGLVSPAGWWPQLVGNGVATSAAFVFLFAGLSRVGATRTAVVMTLEAVFGVALAAAFLGEGLSAGQLAGGAAVVTGAALAALAAPRAPAAELARGGAGAP
jgi:drug/metabolite transporter (DMT)-like permease